MSRYLQTCIVCRGNGSIRNPIVGPEFKVPNHSGSSKSWTVFQRSQVATLTDAQIALTVRELVAEEPERRTCYSCGGTGRLLTSKGLELWRAHKFMAENSEVLAELHNRRFRHSEESVLD